LEVGTGKGIEAGLQHEIFCSRDAPTTFLSTGFSRLGFVGAEPTIQSENL
jgi:hypothetical protein